MDTMRKTMRQTTRQTLGTIGRKTFGMPMVILAIAGTVTVVTVAGVARAARAMGPMSAGCRADDSGPTLKELIGTLKGQSAAPRSEAKTTPVVAEAAHVKKAEAKGVGSAQGSKRTVTAVASRSGAGAKVSAVKAGGKSTTAAAGTSVATKKPAAKAEPAAAKKAATTKKSAGSARPSSAEKKPTGGARAPSARKSSAM